MRMLNGWLPGREEKMLDSEGFRSLLVTMAVLDFLEDFFEDARMLEMIEKSVL